MDLALFALYIAAIIFQIFTPKDLTNKNNANMRTNVRFLLEVILRTVNPQKAEMRRREILLAAKTCFENRGFHSTTMAEICAAANISAGALYRYFDSKEMIIHAMAEEEMAGVRGNIIETIRLIENGKDPISTLESFFEDTIMHCFTREQCSMAAELIAEAMRNPKFAESAKEAYLELNANMVSLFSLLQQKGLIEANTDLKETVSVIMAAIDGLVLRTAFCTDIDAKTSTKWINNLVRQYLVTAPNFSNNNRVSNAQ